MMNQNIFILSLALVIQIAHAGNWSDLKVTWGINPFNSQYFQSVPLFEQDAIKAGWKMERDCSKVNGKRYLKDNDRSVLLVFDASGSIAGIASAIPKGLPFNFPSAAIQPYFQDEGDSYVLTAYFVDPNTICSSTGKPAVTFGDRVLVKGQSGSVSLPLFQKDAESSLFWTKGNCFYTMGLHFWSNVKSVPISENMSSDDFFPMFLLYNSGKLNGFGFAFNADLTSPRYEHPAVGDISKFMNPVPKFFSDPTKSNKLSTMHIFLDSNPRFNFC
jgi:hypothetical protein